MRTGEGPGDATSTQAREAPDRNRARASPGSGRAREWLPRKDLNLDKQDQNLLCYRYTTGHRKSMSEKNFRHRSAADRAGLVTPPGLEPGTNRTKTCCATDYTTGYRARQCSDASPVVYDFLLPRHPRRDRQAASDGRRRAPADQAGTSR